MASKPGDGLQHIVNMVPFIKDQSAVHTIPLFLVTWSMSYHMTNLWNHQLQRPQMQQAHGAGGGAGGGGGVNLDAVLSKAYLDPAPLPQ